MASKREPDDSRFIDNVKRMKICWDSILSEETEGHVFQSPSTSKPPYTKWLRLGMGTCREDGSSSSSREDIYGRGTIMSAQKKTDSGSSGLCTNWLTLKIDSYIEDGSSKHICVMDEAKDAEKRGESSSCREDDTNKRVEGREEESMLVGHISEDILNMIFCKIPLHTLFQVQIVSTSWQSIVSSSAYFHNMWEQSNGQMWLVMELCDETSGSSSGLAFYDVSRRLKYKRIFNEDWRCSDSQWFLRAGDGGLLIYSCKRKGTLRVINPLTMQSHCLEDARLNRKSKLSYYMKKYHDDVAVQLKFDPKKKTYQVTVIIGKLNLPRRRNFIFLIYKSAEQRWEISEARLEHRVFLHMPISFFPNIFTQNQKLYWICKYATDVGTCDLNGDAKIKFLYIPLRIRMQGTMCRTLGVVVYKGRMIMICKGEPLEFPPYTHALIFYEFDELEREWRSKHEAISSPKNLSPGVICFGGDYIWIIQESEGYVSHIICIDLDSGEPKIWPEVYPFTFNVRKCLSMPLSFCPCF